jgi:solute carrier family 35 protein
LNLKCDVLVSKFAFEFNLCHCIMAAFLTSCASAFILNYATYLCTQVNDALTTSVVGRTKSVVQGVGGLFAFQVKTGAVNVSGLVLNSLGICWYAWWGGAQAESS